MDPTNSMLVSSISLAEIAIKASTGKLSIDPSLEADHYRGLLEAIAASGLEVIPYQASDAVLLREMPFHHRDPFDRMLITQAMRLDCSVMTVDPAFNLYPVQVLRT